MAAAFTLMRHMAGAREAREHFSAARHTIRIATILASHAY